MQAISLARALQIKKRLAGRLTKANAELVAYNSQVVGDDEVDVQAIDTLRKSLVKALLDLKVAIFRANVESGIQAKVVLIGEKRAEAALLATVPTRHGKVQVYAGHPATDYKAYLRKSDVDKRVRELEVEIDDLQQEINEINATKKIEINDDVIKLTR